LDWTGLTAAGVTQSEAATKNRTQLLGPGG